MRKLILAATMFAVAAPIATPAMADPPRWAKAYGKRDHDRYDRYDRYDRDDRYERRRYYRTDNGINYWRGDDGRYYCKRSNGTTGLLVGAAAGALLGRAIDTRGDRTTGLIVGAAAGALLGREVERGSARCR